MEHAERVNKLCSVCCHWIEEHDADGCHAPGCECPKFVEIADPSDPLHIEELEADALDKLRR